jgi:hypothetical protein
LPEVHECSLATEKSVGILVRRRKRQALAEIDAPASGYLVARKETLVFVTFGERQLVAQEATKALD